MSPLVWLGVGLLGGLGALARFAVGAGVGARFATGFPVGTLAVNISGSLALGLLVGLSDHTNVLHLAATGLLGSYTTFSTWMLESERLAESGDRAAAFANVALSLALGVAAVWLGMKLTAGL